MAYYEDDDDEGDVDYGTYNEHSGWSANSVQARDIHGDINFHAADRDYFPALPWGFTVAIFAMLFVVATAYTFAIASLDLSLWDWVKLVLSTVLLVPVFVATEYRLHGVEFLALRLLVSVVIVALAVGQGLKVAAIKDLVTLLAHWLVWRF